MSKTSAAKAKGRQFENDVVEYLVSKSIACERRVRAGAKDKGDVLIYADPTFTIEAKNEKKITLSSYVEELKVEIENNNGTKGMAVVKRPRQNVSQSYVVMTLEMFMENYYGK